MGKMKTRARLKSAPWGLVVIFFFLLFQVDLSPESPGDVQEPSGRKPSVSVVTADVGLVSMVRQGILALQLLPSNSSAGWLPPLG